MYLLGIIQQEVGALGLLVLPEVGVLDLGLVREEGGGPDLAVGVRVGAAHHRPLVLEDLYPPVSDGFRCYNSRMLGTFANFSVAGNQSALAVLTTAVQY
jgi:hypothetical protein